MLSAVSSTTKEVNAPKFVKHSSNFKFDKNNYSGRGYTTGRYPVWPLKKAEPWQTNTSIELAQIVYPDGTRKNASVAQSKISGEQELASARIKIDQLTRLGTPEALAEAEKLQHRYFPSEIQVNELRALQPPLRNLGISAAGHALAAERQRQDILDELRVLSGLSRVTAGIVPRPPPAPPLFVGRIPPAGSGSRSAVPPAGSSSGSAVPPAGSAVAGGSSSTPFVSPALSSTAVSSSAPVTPSVTTIRGSSTIPPITLGATAVAPSASGSSSASASPSPAPVRRTTRKTVATGGPTATAPTASASSSTASTPVTSPRPAPVLESFSDEAKFVDSIKNDLTSSGVTPPSVSSFSDLITAIQSESDATRQKAILKATTTQISSLDDKERSKPGVRDSMIKLALIELDKDPALSSKFLIAGNVKRYETIRQKLREML